MSKRLKLIPVTQLFILAVQRIDGSTADVPTEDSSMHGYSPELPQFDAVLRKSLSTPLNIDLDDDRWTHASLPVSWCGLRILSAVCWHLLPIWLLPRAL